MSKGSARASKRIEVIEESTIKQTVDLFVDFAEERKMPARLVMLAMQHIVEKIKAHLELEVIEPHEGTDTLH